MLFLLRLILPLKRVLPFLLRVLVVMPAILGIVLLLWGLVFPVYSIAAAALLLILAVHPFARRAVRVWVVRVISIILLIVLSMAFYKVPFKEINTRIEELSERLEQGTPPESFSFSEKLGIYGLHISMGLAGSLLYPEVAKEHLLMLFPAPRDSIRTFYSDFALGSEKVGRILIQFCRELENASRDRVVQLGPRRVSWHGGEYKLGHPEARYGLALNGNHVSATALWSEGRWKLSVLIEVKIRYPKRSVNTLIAEPLLVFDEGLLWILQESHWIHPYKAEWRFTFECEG